jgi:hypothetical protein
MAPLRLPAIARGHTYSSNSWLLISRNSASAVRIWFSNEQHLPMSTEKAPRRRLTITVSAELHAVLGETAGPRRVSYWLEEAAWRRIRDERDRDLSGIGALVDAEEDLTELGAGPRWSGFGA